jgi:hypothetical protein
MGASRAEVTNDPDKAAKSVANGSPVVLVGPDAGALGAALATSPDRDRRERLLGVMVGEASDPAVMAAAAEMAGELWPWAGGGAGDEASEGRPGHSRSERQAVREGRHPER